MMKLFRNNRVGDDQQPTQPQEDQIPKDEEQDESYHSERCITIDDAVGKTSM